MFLFFVFVLFLFLFLFFVFCFLFFFHQNYRKGCERDFLDARGHFILRFFCFFCFFFFAAGDKPSEVVTSPPPRTRVNVLHTFKNDKAPDNDGLTAKFYKTFWHLFGKDVVGSLNTSFECGELSNSQNQGVITLILKKGKDKRKICNYRPITLLNMDLKIGSKAIASRITNLLPSLIGYEQTAFVNTKVVFGHSRWLSSWVPMDPDSENPFSGEIFRPNSVYKKTTLKH